MRPFFIFSIVFLFLLSCTGTKNSQRGAQNPLNQIVKDPRLKQVINNPDKYEVQIILTQINRDEQQKPHFKTWHWNVDSTHYFYPASTVKMPLAFLALEKINNLRASGYPRMSRDIPYRLDSVQAAQRTYVVDSTAPMMKPTIGHDIRAIFAVSDNDAYNHLFDFLGRQYINETLQLKGYDRTGIVHRFYASKRDQSLAQPITFYTPTYGLFKEGEKRDPRKWVNPQKNTSKGTGYKNSDDALVKEPFDFSTKNWFALTDMERMLRSVLFPEAMPTAGRFNFSKDDLRFLHKNMGLFPREYEYPRYDTAHYWDGYVKFFVMGDSKAPQDGAVRLFNKVGEAYGTLTDVAYVVDYESQTEFVLAATILCNTDGVFNDDQYDYDNIGFPFLADLGRAVLDYERKRVRAVKPDLRYWRDVVK
jgi:Beta-lactamase enzyme family